MGKFTWQIYLWQSSSVLLFIAFWRKALSHFFVKCSLLFMCTLNFSTDLKVWAIKNQLQCWLSHTEHYQWQLHAPNKQWQNLQSCNILLAIKMCLALQNQVILHFGVTFGMHIPVWVHVQSIINTNSPSYWWWYSPSFSFHWSQIHNSMHHILSIQDISNTSSFHNKSKGSKGVEVLDLGIRWPCWEMMNVIS